MSSQHDAPAPVERSWEQVLAEVEADVLHSRSLLGDRSWDDSGSTSQLAPAAIQLPRAAALPPLESMPPVPPELADRIVELRLRVIALQTQLAEEMAGIRAAVRTSTVPIACAAPTSSPTLIDSML